MRNYGLRRLRFPQSSWKPIPPGIYTGRIDVVTTRKTSDGDKVLLVNFEVNLPDDLTNQVGIYRYATRSLRDGKA